MYNHYAIILSNVSSLLKFDRGPCFYLCWFSKRWNIHTSLEKQERHIFFNTVKNAFCLSASIWRSAFFLESPNPRIPKSLVFSQRIPTESFLCAISQKLRPHNYKPKRKSTTYHPLSFSGPKKHTVRSPYYVPSKISRCRKKTYRIPSACPCFLPSNHSP